jgi:hypothetical protein
MERFTLTVTVETDGNAEQLAALLTEFITDPGCPLMADYSADHPDRGVDGYDGPFVRGISATAGASVLVSTLVNLLHDCEDDGCYVGGDVVERLVELLQERGVSL